MTAPSQRLAVERAELGTASDGSITETNAGKEGDTDFVAYPHASSSSGRRFLNSHLRKGKAKDDEKRLAIYFF